MSRAEHGGEAQPEQAIVQGAGETIEDVHDSTRPRTDLWRPASDTTEASHAGDQWDSARVDPRGAVERSIGEPYTEPLNGGNRTEPERLMADMGATDKGLPPETPVGGPSPKAGKQPAKAQTPPEQPGQDGTNPVTHALADDPFNDPPGQPTGSTGSTS